jgi:HEAT repeat protein
LLSFVHESFRRITNPKVLANLLPALNGRTDQKSVDILTELIIHDDVSVRDYAGEALTGTCPDKLKTILSASFLSAGRYPSNVFHLAIGCGLDSLQHSAENIYNSPVGGIMQANALSYLAVYPSANSLKIFREVIYKEDQDTMLSRVAATGLGKLRDIKSIGKIIEISQKERKGSDWNCTMYIKALAKIGGRQSKEYISSFLKSENQFISEMVSKIINTWPER